MRHPFLTFFFILFVLPVFSQEDKAYDIDFSQKAGMDDFISSRGSEIAEMHHRNARWLANDGIYKGMMESRGKINLNMDYLNSAIKKGEQQYGGVTFSIDSYPKSTSKARQQSKQMAEQRRRIRNAQIERRNQEIREHNRKVARERAAAEARRRAEIRERERQEYQRRYNEEYNRSMNQSAERYEKNVNFALQQKSNMEELKQMKIDNLPERSGYIPSESHIIVPRGKTSIAGIVSKGKGTIAVHGLDVRQIPITQYKDPAYFPKLDEIKLVDSETTTLSPLTNQVWRKLQDNCSENKFAMLKHEMLKLNNGIAPVFLGYNDAGNAVFEGENYIYSVTPNGDRIFFMSVESKEEGVVPNYLDGKDVMDIEIGTKGRGHYAEKKYSLNNKGIQETSNKENVSKDLFYSNMKNDEKNINDAIDGNLTNNFSHGLNVESKIKLFDNTSTANVNYIRINENSIHEFYASSTAGNKIEARANLSFKPIQKEKDEAVNNFLKLSNMEIMTSDKPKINNKKMDASADISLETLSLNGGYAYKRIKCHDGQKFLFSYSVGGEVGHKLSTKTYKTYGLYGKVFFNFEVERLNDF